MIQNVNTKIVKQIINPNKILIKLTASTKKELIETFLIFCNYGNAVKIRKDAEITIDLGLNYLNNILESVGYFRSTLEDFLKTLENYYLIKLLNRYNLYCTDNKIPIKLINESKLNAQKFYNEIPEENIKELDHEIENI